MQAFGKKRAFVFAVITVFTSLFFSIVAVETVLRFLRPSNTAGGQLDGGLFIYHPKLGWTISRDWRGGHRHHDYEVRYSTNGFGHRGTSVKRPKVPGDGVCQTSCPPISCGVSDFKGAGFAFWVQPDGSCGLPVAGFS